jgi:hypothetical protein
MDGSLGEALTRAALEEIFPGKPFIKTRSLPWLGGLELDGYNIELSLAFEYHGIQHFQYVPYFHNGDPAALDSQRERDRRKRRAAIEAQVLLIEISYHTRPAQIRERVRRLIKDLGYAVPDTQVSDEDFMAAAKVEGTLTAAGLRRVHAIAESHGGFCLSDQYINCHTELLFQCANDHVFAAEPANIGHADNKRPRWCRECGGTRRRTDEENSIAVAAAPGYELLDVYNQYGGDTDIRSQVWFTIRCPAGHEYEVKRDNFLPVVNGKPRRGCSPCEHGRANRARGEIQRAERALTFGLIMIGPFGDLKMKTRWECIAEGHKFTASWETVRGRKGKKCLRC